MKSAFSTGQLRICPALLDVIPRSALIAAIVRHATSRPEAGPIRTEHEHDGRRFYLETCPDRLATTIRLS